MGNVEYGKRAGGCGCIMVASAAGIQTRTGRTAWGKRWQAGDRGGRNRETGDASAKSLTEEWGFVRGAISGRCVRGGLLSNSDCRPSPGGAGLYD